MSQVKQTAKLLRIEGLQRLAEIPLPIVRMRAATPATFAGIQLSFKPRGYEDARAGFWRLLFSLSTRPSMLKAWF